MNYNLIYENLITRATNRVLNCYTESHHIIPKCLGGTDDKENLVDLTPEEHYLAHQILVKIHPGDHRIALASSMMSVGNDVRGYKNKRYGWLRKLHSKAMQELQSGSKNSQSGTVWIHNFSIETSKKVPIASLENYLQSGWIKGRIVNFSKYKKICSVCDSSFIGDRETCSTSCLRALISVNRAKTNPLNGREKEFLDLYEKHNSMHRALKEMGFPGATSHYYDNAKRILKTIAG